MRWKSFRMWEKWFQSVWYGLESKLLTRGIVHWSNIWRPFPGKSFKIVFLHFFEEILKRRIFCLFKTHQKLFRIAGKQIGRHFQGVQWWIIKPWDRPRAKNLKPSLSESLPKSFLHFFEIKKIFFLVENASKIDWNCGKNYLEAFLGGRALNYRPIRSSTGLEFYPASQKILPKSFFSLFWKNHRKINLWKFIENHSKLQKNEFWSTIRRLAMSF